MQNRVIKFRGFRLDKSEMVYGDLIHGVGRKAGRVYILPLKENLAYIKDCDPLDGIEVIPGTEAQFTGLTDKNGVEIYEGDVVEKCYGSSVKTGVVAWHQERAMFILQDGFNEPLYQLPLNMIEVIGNVFENPELLNP